MNELAINYDACEIDETEAGFILRFDLARMRKGTSKINFKKNNERLPEWAERRRVLPEGTPFPGKWKNRRTPYMVEIGNDLSPQSPTEVVTFIKFAQGGGTAGTAENLIGHTIDVDPGPLLYCTATKDLAIDWSEVRIGPMLELCGLDEVLRSPTNKKGARSTGNKVLSKMFPGGHLRFASYGQVALMRSTSFQKIIFDEIDAATDSHEGSARKIGEVRTTAYEGRRKICLVSTPLEKTTSKIWKAFLEGDQRYYYVPCPHCDDMIQLNLLDENLKCRLEYEFMDEAKTIVDRDTVGLPCPECGCLIKNEQKRDIYRSGKCEWRAHNETPLPLNKSYAIDAAYAPPGMVSFKTLAQEWVDALKDPEDMKAFITLRGARPWEESGDMPTDEQVKSKVSGYSRKTKPEEAILVTCGGDLHKDRLDLEIVGWNGRTSWSIDWMHYHGNATMDKGGSLYNFAKDFADRKLPGDPKIGFVDMKYEQGEVVRMAATNPDLFAIQGESWIGSGAPFAESILKKYDGMEFVRVNTGLLKGRIMNNLKLEPFDGGTDFPSGYPHFPSDYEDLFFDQLNSEARAKVLDSKTGEFKKWQWIKTHSKGNHALDCRVYAMAACEYQIYRIAKMMGLTENYIELIWDSLRNPEAVAAILQD
jgi:phage terminase large subunit GpA-like protein